tara:strand:+ start:107 stop:274 length:168 start_codon:yes stop_codon:yes gene_type:complete
MRQLLEMYNEAAERFEDFAFKYILPPTFKLIEIALKLTLFYSFYLLVKNSISEAF